MNRVTIADKTFLDKKMNKTDGINVVQNTWFIP